MVINNNANKITYVAAKSLETKLRDASRDKGKSLHWLE